MLLIPAKGQVLSSRPPKPWVLIEVTDILGGFVICKVLESNYQVTFPVGKEMEFKTLELIGDFQYNEQETLKRQFSKDLEKVLKNEDS